MSSSQRHVSSGSAVTEPGPLLENLHVLVVDDHDDARELLAIVLEGAGAKVTQADSVSVALQAFADRNFGVLVSDIGMPVQDGYDLIRQLRAGGGSPESRAVPAVAVTAFSAAEDRRKSLAAGFQEHLPKPVDGRALVEVVARLAGLPAVHPASGAPALSKS